MTKIKAILFVLASTSFLFACGDNSEKTTENELPKSAVVSGEITNPKNDMVMIAGPKDSNDTLWIDDAGSFSGEITLDSTAEYRFLHGGEYARIFLSPGDSIHLSLDTKDIDQTLIFGGDHMAVNTYFVNQVLNRENWNNKYPPRSIHELDPTVFVSAVDSMYSDQRETLQKLAASGSADDLVVHEEISIDFREAKEMIMYEPRRKQQLGVAEVRLPEGFYSFMDDLDLNDPNNLEVPAFDSFMNTYLFLEVNKEHPGVVNDPGKQLTAMFDVIDEKITNSEIKQELYTSLTLDNLKYRGLNGMEEAMPKVKEVVTDSAQLALIEEELAKWEDLATGQPAPGFTAVDIEGNSMSLADMKGEFVYLDVWATWCAPCRMEIPHLEEMQKSLKGENIRFVSISLDEDKKAWKEMVTEDNLGGTQIHIADEAKRQFSKDYLITGIPRFMIFNPNGEIVTVKATRPSMGAEEELRELLAKGATVMN
jgi:thiol-disulfide isomerase/thioredoxin